MGLKFSVAVFCLICQVSLAQQPAVQRFTIADGMPFTEVTYVHVGNKGYLWVSYSNASIARFDGSKFTHFTAADFHMDNSLLSFFEDEHGVWLDNQVGEISRFRNEQWIKPSNNELIDRWACLPEIGVVGLNFKGDLFDYDSTSNAWVKQYSFNLGNVQQDSVISMAINTTFAPILVCRYQDNGQEIDGYWLISKPSKGELKFVLTREDNKGIRLHAEDALYFVDEKGSLFYQNQIGDAQSVTEVQDNEERQISLGHFIKLNGQTLVQPDVSNNSMNPIYLLSPDGKASHFLNIKDRIINAAEDRVGNLWLASHSGLLKVNTKMSMFLADDPAMVKNLHCIAEDSEGRIWFGGYQDGFSTWDGHKLEKYAGDELPFSLLPGSYRDDKGNVYFWNQSSGLMYYDGSQFHKINIVDSTNGNYARGYYIHPLSSGELALGTKGNGIVLLKPPYYDPPERKYINKRKGILIDNVLTIEEDVSGRIWAGRWAQGIAVYDPHLDEARTWLVDSFPNEAVGALSMARDTTGNIWLGTQKGLYLLKEPHRIGFADQEFLDALEKPHFEDLNASPVAALKVYNGQLIISTTEGHGFLDLESFYAKEKNPRLMYYNTIAPEKGGAGEQNAILIDREGGVWIGKDRGAIRIDLEEMMVDTFPVKLSPPSVTSGGQTVAFDSTFKGYKLPVSKRNLRVVLDKEFHGSLEDNVRYRYRIRGPHSKDTSYTLVNVDRLVTLDYLSPGRYFLDVKATRYNRVEDEASYAIEVPYASGEDPRLWILGILILVALSGAIVYQFIQKWLLRKKIQLEKEELAGKLMQTQVKALTSSLNPHFINNALHWLQYRVKNDPEAVALVGRLSENIRTIFLHSRDGRPFHSLAEEIRLVENYLLVQKVRYGETIEYELPETSKLGALKDVMVLLLQIQIHVENAIEHGIRNRKEGRKVKVEILDEGDAIHVVITDDGIGRIKARAMGSSGTQQGTQMLKELRELFNARNEEKIRVKYEDTPFKDAGEPYGTVVHILIPKNYDYGNHPA